MLNIALMIICYSKQFLYVKKEKQWQISQIVDEIEFELPYGVFGKLFFEGYAYKQLHKIFGYRKIATIRALK